MNIKKKEIIAHILFWIAYLTFLMTQFSRWEYIDDALWRALIIIFPQILLAYLNIVILIPMFLIQKKYWVYFGALLLSLIAIFYYYRFVPELFNMIDPAPDFGKFPNRPGPHWSRSIGFGPGRMRATMHIMQALIIVLASTAYKMVRIAILREQETSLLRSENLHSELKFLKAQINPHFLFNALNNIYTLSIIKSADTPDMILKLSEMLRYILYDCNEDKVLLEKEISYMNNYITLQKLKDERIDSIDFTFDNVDGKIMIAPMLLIPFLENAFKHSKIEDFDKGWIKISLHTEDKRLEFVIENSMPDHEYTKDGMGGIGLENVRRRLALLYPDKHELKILQQDNIFYIKLSILL